MELVGLVIVIAAIAAYYGVFGSLEVASDMVNVELRDAKRTQAQRIAKKYVNMEIHEDQFDAAKKNIAKLDALEL